VRGRLILAGSGEFTAAMDDLDREILASIGKSRPRVAVVPTASGLEDTPASWAALGETHFGALGADVVPVMVLRRDDAREQRWIDALRDVDWV
jgi:peptidase E